MVSNSYFFFMIALGDDVIVRLAGKNIDYIDDRKTLYLKDNKSLEPFLQTLKHYMMNNDFDGSYFNLDLMLILRYMYFIKLT
jgi:hypothetical protein